MCYEVAFEISLDLDSITHFLEAGGGETSDWPASGEIGRPQGDRKNFSPHVDCNCATVC